MFHVINVNMAAAIREISVQKGYDPREFPLICAGGAGPIHGASIAAELDMGGVIVPRELRVARLTFVTPAPLPAKLPVNWLAALLNTTAPVNTALRLSRAMFAGSRLSATVPVMPAALTPPAKSNCS